MNDISNHVISIGAGAISSQNDWEFLEGLGVTIWLSVDSLYIARRLLVNPLELKARPLLASIIDDTKKLENDSVEVLSKHIQEINKTREEFYTQSKLHIETTYLTQIQVAMCISGKINDGVIH